MEKQVLISVIVPVYNIAEYLPTTLKCLATQTYRELEIILIDDGSTDNSLSICQQFAEQHPHTIVIHQENQGVSAARNKGISVATGDLISFIDSDDMLSENMLEQLCDDLHTTHSDLAICNTDFIDTHTTGLPAQSPDKTALEIFSNVKNNLCELIWGVHERKFYCIWDKLFKKSLIDKYGLTFQHELRIGEDTLFTICYLTCCETISINPETLYHHRIRQGSLMRSNCNQLARQHIIRADKIEEFAIRTSQDRAQTQRLVQSFKARIPIAVFAFSSKQIDDIKDDIRNLRLRKDIISAFREHTKTATKRERILATILQHLPLNTAARLINILLR